PEDVALDAVVPRDDMTWRVRAAPFVRVLGGDAGRQIQPAHRRARGQFRPVGVRRLDAGTYETAHDPDGPQVTSEAARINFRNDRYLRGGEPRPQALLRTPVRVRLGELSHDHASHLWPCRLGVLGVHAVVADHRRGHHDDLAAIRGIGERLLIAAHAG